MKRISLQTLIVGLLVVVIVLQFVLLGWFAHSQQRTNKNVQQEFQTQQSNSIAAANAASYTHVTISVADAKVYIPELGLALPMNSDTISLVYKVDTAYPGAGAADEASISTLAAAESTPMPNQARACDSLVRIKFEAKSNPYNPEEKNVASLQLADGRTLQVYSYHLQSCKIQWNLAKANPDIIANVFKQVSVY